MKAYLLLPLLLGLPDHLLPAPVQSPGTFTPAGNMTKARYGHTATLLLDGKVLIAGGTDGRPYNTQANTEVYDSATRTSTVTRAMITARSFHTATLLPDGKVLVAGGLQFLDSLASAELYDPVTGTFTATGNMTKASAYHSATLLNNGLVLIAGGGDYTSADTIPRSAGELYDSATGRFAGTGPMTLPQFGPTATLLADGAVLVASPNFFPNIPLVIASQVQSFGATSEVYKPLAGEFSLNNKGDGTFLHHTATLLPSGKVLLAGGACTQCLVVLASTLLYDPGVGTFTPTRPMNAHRSGHAATHLPDGTVLITGGVSAIFPEPALPSAEIYHPLTGIFNPAANMTTGRAGHRATLLNNGEVLITGGRANDKDRGDVILAHAELYRPAVLVTAPRLFSLSGDGTGQGAIWHSTTGRVVSLGFPAAAGDILSLYATSLGQGSVIPPQVAIGGRFSEILFFGDAPGYPGFSQVNVQVPNGVGTGANVPVRLTYLGRSSNEVTLAVQ